jgi:hypothetical protein
MLPYPMTRVDSRHKLTKARARQTLIEFATIGQQTKEVTARELHFHAVHRAVVAGAIKVRIHHLFLDAGQLQNLRVAEEFAHDVSLLTGLLPLLLFRDHLEGDLFFRGNVFGTKHTPKMPLAQEGREAVFTHDTLG